MESTLPISNQDCCQEGPCETGDCSAPLDAVKVNRLDSTLPVRTEGTVRKSPLETILAYQNPAVVHRYTDKLGLNEEEAKLLFEDTKKFLFLCGTKSKGDPALAPSKKVDAGWHEFLLFTEDYQAFCRSFFGKFIHHRPRHAEDPKGDGRDFQITRALATAHFGLLSDNWGVAREMSSCVSCDGGGCNEPECHGDDVGLEHQFGTMAVQ